MLNENVRILVVEDDVRIRNFIVYALEKEGFISLKADNGHTAISLLLSEKVDILLLDMGLPDADGMDIIVKVREWSQMPIIVVSARDQDKEKAAALDAGADDYLTKPFSSTELLARIRVSLRHLSRQTEAMTDAVMRVRGLALNMDKRQVHMNGVLLHLTPMEFDLLAMLFKNIGKVLTTTSLLQEIWGIGHGNDTQVLRTLMAGLRRKIELEPANPQYIMTEIGVGYRLVDE